MTSKVVYTGELRTVATHLRSGKQIITDAPCDNQGKGEAFSPTDLVATSLASCMLTIMGIKARDEGIDIEGAGAEVNKIMASDPRRIERVELTLTMPDKGYSVADKQFLEEAARGCPVCRSVSEKMDVAIAFVW